MALSKLQTIKVQAGLNAEQHFVGEVLPETQDVTITIFSSNEENSAYKIELTQQGLQDLVEGSLELLKVAYNTVRTPKGEYMEKKKKGPGKKKTGADAAKAGSAPANTKVKVKA